MEIVIVASGLPFGPDTLSHVSLGGSETAALMMAKELGKQGNIVNVFCNLPSKNRPDHVESGYQDKNNVRWIDINLYSGFISSTQVDLLIGSRQPSFFEVPNHAKKAVLWTHDLMLHSHVPAMMAVLTNIDEIWCVSKFHKAQIHKVLGIPKDKIWVTRNGIVNYDDLLVPGQREGKTLLYSARPERGLENLVKPGGIMERLPDYKLYVTMYDNFPEHMRDYYNLLWGQCNALPNVELLGVKKQFELRQLMRNCWAYVYPTAFEETSCIIARECIEQALPVICTKVGALPETLGNCAHYDETPQDKIGSEEFCESFAKNVERLLENISWHNTIQDRMSERKDLYWGPVAKSWVRRGKNVPVNQYSKILSMWKDSDIIAAKELLDSIKDKTEGMLWIEQDIYIHYPFLNGSISMEDHYEEIYKHEVFKQVLERQEMLTIRGHNRYNAIKEDIEKQKPQTVIEYGCAEGPVILGLAQDFPEIQFFGIDFVKANIDLCLKYAKDNIITNVAFATGSVDDWPSLFAASDESNVATGTFDFGIIAEVLEHCIEPWDVLTKFESHVKADGKISITVPQGAWEYHGLVGDLRQWPWRAHIWHIDKWSIRTMLKAKKSNRMAMLTDALDSESRIKGHMYCSYTADHKPIPRLDIVEKSINHLDRQSVAACMISMNDEDTILRCLNSIDHQFDILQIAFGPTEDKTKQLVQGWVDARPYVEYRSVSVPRIKAKEYGFDDARNASIEGIEADWILWIDTDEYLSGNIRPFLRENPFDSYAIHQHHFSVEPRGGVPQVDKPARLFRNNGKFTFMGKVHEHAEKGANGGPGFCTALDGVDIGHTGYVNDEVRQARFLRNFPLLEWDREINPDRRLGKYLWLRDLIHIMQIYAQRGDMGLARKAATEAVDFWRDYHHQFEGVGGGNMNNQSLHYYSQAMGFLQTGFGVRITMEMADGSASYQGVFKDVPEALEMANKAINEKLKFEQSRYK